MNSAYLEVAAGLALIFAVVASIVAALNSFFTQILSIKARVLWSALANVLDNNQGKSLNISLPQLLTMPLRSAWKTPKVGPGAAPTMTGQLANHPLVKSLDGRRDASAPLSTSRTKVDFIPKEVLSAALADLGQGANPLAGLSASVQGTPLAGLVDTAAQNLQEATAAVEGWFDGYMARISELYRVSARKVLFVVGLVLAVAFNVNAIGLTSQLLHNSSQRAVLIGSVAGCDENDLIGCATNVVTNLQQSDEAINLPVVGDYVAPWDALSDAPTRTDGLTIVIGWLISGLAVSFGAPFWFDLLKRLGGARKGS